MRKHAFLEAGEEHARELETLRGMERHERHAARLFRQLVDVAHQRDTVEEALERRIRLRALVVLGRGDELLEVFESRLRLRGALLLERGPVAGRIQDQVDERRQLRARAFGREARDERRELFERAPLLARDVHGRRRREVEEGAMLAHGDDVQPIERRASDPARGGTDGAPEGDVVVRVHDQPQVREDVLDLLALVEPYAAHDDVRDAGAAQRILQHA